MSPTRRIQCISFHFDSRPRQQWIKLGTGAQTSPASEILERPPQIKGRI